MKRTAFAEEPNTNLIVIGGVPGKAYETHGWEIWAPLQPLYRAGEYEQVADRLETELPEDAKWPMLHYNAACIYSLTGRKEKALTHLTKAMELAPDNVRGYAENDDDLANIREEPEFQQLFHLVTNVLLAADNESSMTPIPSSEASLSLDAWSCRHEV